MDKIDVTVIIPVYNASLLLNRSLDAVFSQKTQYSVEVILIDDGSTDNSVELIKNRKEKNIILLQQPNSGPAAARNKGIDIATGKYLAFLDADDYWLPEFVEDTVSFLESNTQAIAVSVGQKHKIINTQERFVPYFLKNQDKNAKPQILPDFFEFWGTYEHVCTGSVLLRTDVAKMTGGQRVDLRITEDLEFWAYLAAFGVWGFIPKILFVSDGNAVTAETGWLAKMKHRWENAPSVEEWEQRIITSLTEPLSQGYSKSRGVIARNLCYSQILSGRIDLSRNQVKKYGKDFPSDKISVLLKIAVKNKLLWQVTTNLLIYREYHRKI